MDGSSGASTPSQLGSGRNTYSGPTNVQGAAANRYCYMSHISFKKNGTFIKGPYPVRRAVYLAGHRDAITNVVVVENSQIWAGERLASRTETDAIERPA